MQVLDWQSIIKEYGPAVWRTAYRLLGNYADASDCFEETFICALQLSRRQRVRNFSALLIRLATARAIDLLRLRARNEKYNVASANRVIALSAHPEPVEQLQRRELAISLRKALAKLPRREAQVFCLRYLNDMSYQQIADELGIKTNAAGVILNRAKAKLRKSLAFLLKEQKNEVVS